MIFREPTDPLLLLFTKTGTTAPGNALVKTNLSGFGFSLLYLGFNGLQRSAKAVKL